MFAAVLDTCVLWPSLRRDFLLSLAVEGLFRPLWSDVILDELEFHEGRKLAMRGVPQPQAEARAAHLVQQMRLHFDDALIADWTQVKQHGLPDPDDEHVLAAAVVGDAGVIVTENTRDFPPDVLPASVTVVGPAEFARDAVSVQPQVAQRALEEMSRRRRGQSPRGIIDVLERRYRMVEAAALLREG